MRRVSALAAVVLLAACSSPPPPPRPDISAARIAAHVRFLSDDLLEGRGPGTRGERLATLYIAAQFAQLGLEPLGGDGAYYQKVPLVNLQTVAPSSLTISGRTLKLLDEFVGLNHRHQPEATVEGEAIFVGHGIVAPEFGWNDYQDANVKGKWVVLFTNEPPSTDPKFFGGPALTYYGRWTYKFEEATRQGAAGCIIVHTDKTAGYSWTVVRNSWGGPNPEVELTPGEAALGFAGWVTEKAGDQIFAALGKTAREALQMADTRGFRAVNLPRVRIQARVRTTITRFETHNVLARLPGRDPQLKDEAVLYTAHWDHLGIGTPVNGDAIYNGAVDNATGCGILLETARAWTSFPQPPKRSIVFAAVAAEEGGLRGSEYYARYPAVPAGKTAVDLNYDGIFPFGRTSDVTLNGYERTTLKPLVEEAARSFQLTIKPDPQPGQGHYYRSDHFSLARVGVPAFSLDVGTDYIGKPPGWGQKAFEEYNQKHYHQPSDEFDPKWDFSGLEELARFGFEIGRRVGELPQLPAWQPGDEFLPARQKSLGR